MRRRSLTGINVRLPDNTTVEVTHCGKVHLENGLILENVLYVPNFSYNLISVNKLILKNRLKLIFEEKYGAIVQLVGSDNDSFIVTIRDDLTSQSEVSQVINGHRASENKNVYRTK